MFPDDADVAKVKSHFFDPFEYLVLGEQCVVLLPGGLVYLGDVPVGVGGGVLDVHAGFGFFLPAADDFHWEP